MMIRRDQLGLRNWAWSSVTLVLLFAIEFQLHELGHHFFSAALCGHFGSVSFDYYESAAGCSPVKELVGEIFGPFVSLCLAYGGAAMLLRKPGLLAFGIIFASYFHLRWIPPLLGGGDESDLARKLHLSLSHSHWEIAMVLFFLSLPPLWVAWTTLRARHRLLVFASAYFLPLPFVWYADSFAGWISGPKIIIPLLSKENWLGVPLSLVLWDLAVLLLFWAVITKQGSKMSTRGDHGGQ